MLRDNADMIKIHISEKGANWIVCEDGSIYREAFSGKTTRVRNGVMQQFEHNIKEKKMSQTKDTNGYMYVSAKIGDKRPKVAVHRLIARAFVKGYEPHLHVNHINGKKTDNRPENLEWVSLSENNRHARDMKLNDLNGENQPNHKLSAKQVIHIRKALAHGISANSLSIIANVNRSTIYLIQKGKRWASLSE